jgi:hypothetical protein
MGPNRMATQAGLAIVLSSGEQPVCETQGWSARAAAAVLVAWCLRVIGPVRCRDKVSNQAYIGTERLLLGVMDVGNSVAREALTALGVGVEDVRRDVEGTEKG